LSVAGDESNEGRTGVRGDSTSRLYARPQRGRRYRRGTFSRRLPNMPMPLAHQRIHKPYVRRRIE
ncbi:MAG TPA: hypothetical protein VI756_20155, partial [Blastocatellia bacterium]